VVLLAVMLGATSPLYRAYKQDVVEAKIVLGPVKLPNFMLLYESICYKQWICREIPAACVRRKKTHAADLGSSNGMGSAANKKANKPAAGATLQKHSYQRNEVPSTKQLLRRLHARERP
jgi:hypothetical protein